MGLYIAAPIISLVTALLIFMVIPIGAPITIRRHRVQLAAVDLNIGLLYPLLCRPFRYTRSRWPDGHRVPSTRFSVRFGRRRR